LREHTIADDRWMSPRRRAIVIGLDSAAFDVLKPWMDRGYLPTISRLVRNGASGKLTSTLPPHTAPAWSSFMTGKNPGKHGIFGLMTMSKHHERLQLVSSTDRKAQDLWEILSDNGRKVVLVNVPLTYPVRRVNGVLVSGFMTPPSAPDYGYPESVIEELRVKCGDFKPNVDRSTFSEKDPEASVLNAIEQGLNPLARTVSYLLSSHEWDFFMFVIQGTDEIQHRLWHLMDPNHPRYSRDEASRYERTILRYYQRVDEVLSETLSKIDRETIIVLVSDHGTRPVDKWISINMILWKNRLLFFKRDPVTQLKLLLFRIGVTPINLYRLVLSFQLDQLRRSIKKEETRSILRPFLISLRDVDWSRTKVYSLGGWGQVYVNAEAVPSSEYEEIRQKAIHTLLDSTDPATGEHFFASDGIYLSEQIYHGPLLDKGPDILALTTPPYQGYPDYEFGFNKTVVSARGISGTHAMDGILVIAGPEIKKHISLTKTSIMDIAPTILYLMGTDIPEDMDGVVVAAAIEDSYLSSRPPKYKTGMVTEKQAAHEYTIDEQERLKRMLKDLGYL